MDTTKTITHIGLCAGYGGIELGLKRVLPTMRSVALCEIEAFAIANLVAKMEAGLMDPAPIWTDLKTFPWEEFRDKVDVLSGGYPCQPFSAAGKRLGTDDPRHLWPYIANGIRLLRPKLCFFENVEGHISLGLREVVGELEELGYETTWGIFSAAECGAPHQRKRVFIMAHSNSQRGQLSHWGRLTAEQVSIGNGAAWGDELADSCGTGPQRFWRKCEHGQGCSQMQIGWSGCDVWPSRPGEPQHAWEPPRVVEHSNGYRRECNVPRDASEQDSNGQDDRVSSAAESMEWNTGQTEPTLGGNTDGPASGLDYAELCVTCDNRTDELRLLGNGVVPATAELAFRTLWNQL